MGIKSKNEGKSSKVRREQRKTFEVTHFLGIESLWSLKKKSKGQKKTCRSMLSP